MIHMEDKYGAILRTFVVPPLMLGNSPEPRSDKERNDGLLAMAEAAGLDPLALGSPEIEEAYMRRYRWNLGF